MSPNEEELSMPKSSRNTGWSNSGKLPGLPRAPRLSGLPPMGSGDAPGPPDDPDAIERSETFRLLVDAIDRRLVVLARYDVEPEPRRLCPDRIGIDPHDQYQVEA